MDASVLKWADTVSSLDPLTIMSMAEKENTANSSKETYLKRFLDKHSEAEFIAKLLSIAFLLFISIIPCIIIQPMMRKCAEGAVCLWGSLIKGEVHIDCYDCTIS